MRFLVKFCILNCRSLEGGPDVVPLFIPVNLRTCLWGSLRLCTAHLEPFNHQHCAEEHQYSPKLTEPTRCLPHWQDDVLLSIAVSVKVFTRNIQDACSGAVLLRAQGSPYTMQLLWYTQRICSGVHMPPLIGITRSYILWCKFKISDLCPIHWRHKRGHKLVRKHSVKRKAYIKLKGTQGTQANRCARRRMVVELGTRHQ